MKRQQERENAMIYLYQMLLKASVDIDDFMGDDSLLIGDYRDVIPLIFQNIRSYIHTINETLIEWDFDRLGYIEQSILLLALGEKESIKTPKVVLIDEAVILAKKYCDDETYKMINASLDKAL